MAQVVRTGGISPTGTYSTGEEGRWPTRCTGRSPKTCATQIESGGLQPGQQLRTELELRDHYEASRNTVRDAIKWLISLGLVETRPGQGTFVVQKIDPFVTRLTGDPKTGVGGDEGASYRSEVSEKNREPKSSPVQVEIQEPSDDIADALGVPKDAEVISRHERRFIDHREHGRRHRA